MTVCVEWNGSWSKQREMVLAAGSGLDRLLVVSEADSYWKR